MKCIYCGEETDNDSVFCEYCGKKLVNDAPKYHQDKQDSDLIAYMVYGILGALLVVAIILMCVL